MAERPLQVGDGAVELKMPLQVAAYRGDGEMMNTASTKR